MKAIFLRVSFLKSSPIPHQRTKLLNFSNSHLDYFLPTPPEFSTVTTESLDTSVDEFWAHTLLFPTDSSYTTNQIATSYINALQQIRLGIRDGGCGCYNNQHFVHAVYYTSVADTIQWLQRSTHPDDGDFFLLFPTFPDFDGLT